MSDNNTIRNTLSEIWNHKYGLKRLLRPLRPEMGSTTDANSISGGQHSSRSRNVLIAATLIAFVLIVVYSCTGTSLVDPSDVVPTQNFTNAPSSGY